MAKGDAPQQQARAARLKVALKANIARRKAQARARQAQEKDNNGRDVPSEEKS